MATEKPRFSLTLDYEIFQRLEDYRFANRFQNRSDAAVELIRLGLESLEQDRDHAAPQQSYIKTAAVGRRTQVKPVTTEQVENERKILQNREKK